MACKRFFARPDCFLGAIFRIKVATEQEMGLAIPGIFNEDPLQGGNGLIDSSHQQGALGRLAVLRGLVWSQGMG